MVNVVLPDCIIHNIRQCLRKVVDGHFMVAVKVLSSSGVAPCSEIDSVFGCIKLFPKAGRCPPILAEFVASAPLTPLLKPDNGIRPIAVGTIWRRLVSKVAMKGVSKEMSNYLSDFQFGVGVSGAEAVLHSVNRLLSEYHNDGSLAMLTLNFSNAFNLVDRSALLQEVRVRCDPLGPFLFALVLHPLVHKIRDNCKLFLHAWYLDDRTVIGDSEEVARVLDIIKLRDGLFLVDIRRPSLGVKLLGELLVETQILLVGWL
ncbi:hypothetical protein Tco_1252099 [Tanacetum coccineum]